MAKPAYLLILDEYCAVHRYILEFGEGLTDEQLSWRAAPGTLNIAFFLWHVARWADHLQASLPGMTPQLGERLAPGRQAWEELELAASWGFDRAVTGFGETGMDMDESLAVQLPFPPKDILLAYVRQAFELAEKAIQAVDEAQFLAEEQAQAVTDGIRKEGATVGRAVMAHLTHDVYHFGMMQVLRGQQEPAIRA